MFSEAEESARKIEGAQEDSKRVRQDAIADSSAAPTLAFQPQNLEAVDEELNAALAAHREVGQLNAPTSGVASGAIHTFRKVIRRSLTWYTAPLHLFQGAILRGLRRMLTILQAHETALQVQESVLRAHETALATANANLQELRQEHTSLNRDVSQLLAVVDLRPGRSNMLRENARIIDYWDNAAKTDPMRETVTQFSNESDEEYQKNWKDVGEYVASKIMSYSTPNPVALEIGPGTGRISIPMSRYCRSITALDISAEMVLQARKTMAELTNFEVKLILDEDLQFLPSEHFDLAYSISCFQHAEKKTFYRYLEGIHRALKPGGVLFFGVINLGSEVGWKHFAAIVRNDYPEFFHTPDEISAYLQHAGYRSHQLLEERETLWAIAYR